MIQFHDGWEDDEDEDEAEDGLPEDDSDLDECPHCGRLIYDDSERCPRCGAYLSREEIRSRHPWWVTLGVLVCLAMTVYWILHP